MSKRERAHVDGPPLERLDELIWIGEIPARGAREAPERAAIVFADRGRTTSYAELERQTNAFVAMARARGLAAGDRVAYLGMNSDLYLPVLFGAIRAGLVLVPVNFRLAPPEIAYQLEDSEARLLICDPGLTDAASKALAGLPSPPALLPTEAADGEESLQAELAGDAPVCASPQEAGQIVLQLYTSGTTGRPKGVLVSHQALSLARHAERISPELAHLPDGVISLSAMPNFHIGGMSWVLMGLVRRGTVVLTADPGPANMLKLLREHDADQSFIVPTVLRAMVDELKAGKESAPALSGIYYGAMPIGESLLAQIMETLNCPLVQFFGMTENTGSATMLGPQEHDPARPALLKSVGRPYPGMSVQIRGPDGAVLKPGEPGEIWIQSPTCMSGYWKLPDKTAEAVVDGWYASGDGGYLDEDGYLFLTDRIKDMVVSGGENVYPVEVEEALRRHPAVLDAGVIGLPDERWGEAVAALVELRPDAEVTADALRAHAREQLAGYKCPKAIRFGSLPRTASGKVQRAEIRRHWDDSANH